MCENNISERELILLCMTSNNREIEMEYLCTHTQHTHAHTHMHTHMHTHICTHAHIHTTHHTQHTHTHTHTGPPHIRIVHSRLHAGSSVGGGRGFVADGRVS